MRRVAANMVCKNVTEFHKYHIVELCEHIVVNHYALTEELDMTEWLGGTILLATVKDIDIKTTKSVEDFYESIASCEKSPFLFAYHTPKVLPFSTKLSTDDSSGDCHIKRL